MSVLIIVLMVTVGWTILSLPLACAVGRAIAVGNGPELRKRVAAEQGARCADIA